MMFKRKWVCAFCLNCPKTANNKAVTLANGYAVCTDHSKEVAPPLCKCCKQ